MKSGSFLLLFNKSKTKIFLVLRSDFPVWGLTGGGLNDCEKPDDGAIRESIEETGFDVKLIKYIGKYRNNNFIIFVYEGRKVHGKFKPEFDGCKGRWFSVERLPKDMVYLSKTIIIDALSKGKKPFFKKCSLNNIRDFGLFLRHPLKVLKFFIVKLTKGFLVAIKN